MCRDAPGVAGLEAATINKLYAVIIRDEMKQQGVKVTTLVTEGVIKSHRKNHFFERLEAGQLPVSEFQRLLIRLSIDPVRVGLAMLCFKNASSYQDPCCETTALVAVSMASHLSAEIAACDGEFAPIRSSLCDHIAKRNACAIAEHHRLMEKRHNGEGFKHAFG